MLKVMSIYLQEVAASTFMTDISPEARSKILFAMETETFPLVLQCCAKFSELEFPENAIYF